MRCLGIVLLSILGAAVGFTLLLGAVFGLITLAEASSDYFGFSSFGLGRPLFLFGYMAVIMGTAVGVSICRDQRRV